MKLQILKLSCTHVKARQSFHFSISDIICDWICQYGSCTHTISSHTFHRHSIDTTIEQQFMLIPLSKVQRSAFTAASFMGLSGVHWCSGGLQMAPTYPARQTASRESPQDWMVRLGIDVATFCDMWS